MPPDYYTTPVVIYDFPPHVIPAIVCVLAAVLVALGLFIAGLPNEE